MKFTIEGGTLEVDAGAGDDVVLVAEVQAPEGVLRLKLSLAKSEAAGLVVELRRVLTAKVEAKS